MQWQGVLYLEDGLHRAVRSALRNRIVLHARVFDYDALSPGGELGPSAEVPSAEVNWVDLDTDLSDERR